MARPAGCCGRCCGCCQWLSLCIPPSAYLLIHLLLSLGCLAAGIIFIIFGIRFSVSSAGALLSSKEVYIGALAMGSALLLLGAYCVLAVGFAACKGARDKHMKAAYIFLLLLLLALLAFMLVCLLNAADAENMDAMLDYGWQKAFTTPSKQSLIARAQTDDICCGFASPNDRALQPCPTGAADGCQTKLRTSLRESLDLAGLIFGCTAAGVFLLMGVSHGWIERIAADKAHSSNAAGGDQGDDMRLILDAGRPAKNAAWSPQGFLGRIMMPSNVNAGGDTAFYVNGGRDKLS